jgi:uncharacterized protein YndB with AHSA1/START domain
MLLDSYTATISIDAPPAAVMDLVGDPERLPEWAPGFALSVRRDGEHWVVRTDDGERHLRIRVADQLGVTDYLAPGSELGAFTRIVSNGTGSEMLFTIFFAPDATEQQREAQRATIESELATVRDLIEARRSAEMRTSATDAARE